MVDLTGLKRVTRLHVTEKSAHPSYICCFLFFFDLLSFYLLTPSTLESPHPDRLLSPFFSVDSTWILHPSTFPMRPYVVVEGRICRSFVYYSLSSIFVYRISRSAEKRRWLGRKACLGPCGIRHERAPNLDRGGIAEREVSRSAQRL